MTGGSCLRTKLPLAAEAMDEGSAEAAEPVLGFIQYGPVCTGPSLDQNISLD